MNSETFFMFGGQLSDGSYSDEFWSYTEEGWQLFCGGNSGCSGAPGVRDAGVTGGSSASGAPKFYVMGGKDSSGPSDALWVLEMNPSTEAWQWSQECGSGTGCSGPGSNLGGMLLGAGDGGIFLFGGETGGEVTDQIWVYSPDRVDGRDHTCASFGYVGGTLGCTSGCGFDDSQCVPQPSCGDGIVQASAGEECDGSVSSNAGQCQNFGLGSGSVTCGNDCRFDYSQCAYGYRCGNYEKDHPEEACDGSEDMISCRSVWEGIAGGARLGMDNMSNSPGCEDNCRLRMDFCQQNPCGNGNIDTSYVSGNYNVPQVVYSEACDPGGDNVQANTRGMTCEDFGMTGSILGCNSQCEVDLSNCVAYAASCSNGSTDAGTETDTDCGGSCASCVNGKSCSGDSDCQSGRCAENVCTANTCSDGMKNGKETDVDCGGPDCAGCIKSKACVIDEDCSVCTSAACTSNYSNSSNYRATLCEAQVCKLANETSTCSSDSDCVSGICDTQNTGRCLAYRGDNMCPSGEHEISIGNGAYVCATPDQAACSGQSELSNCSFISDDYWLSGQCYQGACVAECNSWDTNSYGQCANENSFCQPVGILGSDNTSFVCIADTTFDADDECPAGTFEVAVGDGTYRCIPPSEHPCGGAADLNECSYSWNEFSVSGVCMSNTCVASCGSAGMTGFYTSGSRETCTNGNSICQPVGPVGDSSTLGACMDLAQSCAVSGSPVDSVCPAGTFGCMSSGQCGVPSIASCVTGTNQNGETTYAAPGATCSVDMDLDGVADANEAGICTPLSGSQTICMANCSSGSCVARDSANQNRAYCQTIEAIGSGDLEQFMQSGNTNGARDDYAACLTPDSSCSSDSDCKVDSFVGCDQTNHVCLPPSLSACSNNGAPGGASAGTSCDSDGDGSSDGLCVFTVDSSGNGTPDSASICLVSCTTAQGGGDSSYCTTDGASCSGVSDGQAAAFYVCSDSD
jgi:hypothetical protein